jgi:ankyrin repeat protein
MSENVLLEQSPLVAQYRRVWGLEHNEAFSSLTPFLPSTLLSRVAEAGKDISLLMNEPELLQLVVDEPHAPQIANVATNDELFIAAGDLEGENIETIKRIVERDHSSNFPAILDEFGASVLHYAALQLSNHVLEYLLGLEGAVGWVAHKNAAGMTPLMIACAGSSSISTVQSLLNARSDEQHVNAMSAHGCSALHIAVDSGHLDVALCLIKHGASALTRASFCIDKSRAVRPPHVSAVLQEFGVTPIELASLKHGGESDFAQLLIEAALSSMSSGGKKAAPSIQTTSTPTAAARSRQPLRLLTAQKKKAIAHSLLAQGFSSAKMEEVRQLLSEMLDDVPFTETDLSDVVDTLDTTAIHTSTVLSLCEDSQAADPVAPLSSETKKTNRHSPTTVNEVQVFQRIRGTSLEDVKRLTKEGGAAVAIATLGNLILHGHHGTLPICIRQLLSDFVASVEVSIETLKLVVELQPLFSPSISSLSVATSPKVVVFVSHDNRTSSAPFQRAGLVVSSVDREGDDVSSVDFITFEAPQSLLRSLCEVTDATTVNFDESLGHCCLTQSRDVVLPRISGVQSMIPFSSLFSVFNGVLFGATATSRISSSCSLEPLVGGRYERKSDLLTEAIEAQADSFVSFFVSSPYAQVEQRHLVTAAQRGTAAAFQLIFSAMGSAVSTLSTVDPVSGETPVTAAIACGTCLHLTSMLQLASRNLQALNAYGYSPLMVACLIGNESALLHLISLGANVNEVCPRGMTPLIAAIASSLDRMVMPLVQNGAFVTLSDANGLSPLRAAELFGSSAMFPLLHQHDIAGSRGDQLVIADASNKVSPTPSSIVDTAEVVDAALVSPSVTFATMAASSLDQIRSLEMYFSEIAQFRAVPPPSSVNNKTNKRKHKNSVQRTSTSPVAFVRSTPLLPTGAVRIPIQAHNITVTSQGGEDLLPLYLGIEHMVKEVAVILKAMILDPHIVAEYVPLSHPDRSATLWLLSRVGTSVETLVQRFINHPPAEAGTLLELETTFHEAQSAVHNAHRFVSVLHALHRLRVLHATPSSLCNVVEHPIWQRAVHALPKCSLSIDVDGVIAPLSLPTSLVLQALEATLPLVKEHPTVIKALELLLDPHSSGLTTVFEFSFVHQILSEFTDEGLSSLHVLLGYHAVFFNGLSEVNRVWLRRAAPYDYIVVIGPVGVTILTSTATTKTPLGSSDAIVVSSSVETRTYHNVESLLRLESSVLRT